MDVKVLNILLLTNFIPPQKRNFLFSSVNYTNFANYLKISPNSRYRKNRKRKEKKKRDPAPDK
jgi:predicted N-acyltransferase